MFFFKQKTAYEMLKSLVGSEMCIRDRTHAAEASYNNHWGVPLTLARMPVDTDFAVIEIGMNHPGEIAPLARLAKLDVAMITIVAPAHLEACLLYTSDAADDLPCVDLGGCRIIKKKNTTSCT